MRCGDLFARLNYYKGKCLRMPRFWSAVIVTIDGKYGHGGLTDRFRHILSIYSYCKKRGIVFKLLYSYPYNLTEILLPNKYDWRMSESKVSQSFFDTRELFLYVDTSKGKTLKQENYRILQILDKKLFNSRWMQFHVYGNACFAEEDFYSLFHELFRPSPLLISELEKYSKFLPSSYDAVTLRFQNLLGDFKEGEFPEIEEYEKSQLIQKCINKIKKLYEENFFKSKKILVTSDSSLFMQQCKTSLPFACIMPGKVVHVDRGEQADLLTHTRSFVDLYMLMRANRCVLLRTGDMYESGFPAFAARIGNKEFVKIDF